MEKVGFRFYPTDLELIKFYLKNQILGNTKQVEETISEINFYDYDPISLPLLSRNQSDTGIYYFFTLKQYTNTNKRFRKRSSQHGTWKPIGEVTKIKDKSGEKIGDKKVHVYLKKGAPKPKGIKSPWVMHEYQITHSQYQNLNLDTYVICKLFDKREEEHVSSSISPSPKVDEHPSQDIDTLFRNDLIIIPMNIDDQEDLSQWDYNDNNSTNYVHLQTPYLSQADNEFLGGLKHVDRRQIEHLFYDQDLTLMHESYTQKNPVRVTSRLPEVSPVDSIGSSNSHFTSCSSSDPCKDLQTSADYLVSRKKKKSQLTRRTIQSKKVRL